MTTEYANGHEGKAEGRALTPVRLGPRPGRAEARPSEAFYCNGMP